MSPDSCEVNNLLGIPANIVSRPDKCKDILKLRKKVFIHLKKYIFSTFNVVPDENLMVETLQ